MSFLPPLFFVSPPFLFGMSPDFRRHDVLSFSLYLALALFRLTSTCTRGTERALAGGASAASTARARGGPSTCCTRAASTTTPSWSEEPACYSSQAAALLLSVCLFSKCDRRRRDFPTPAEFFSYTIPISYMIWPTCLFASRYSCLIFGES